MEAISRHQGFNVQFKRDGDEILIEDSGSVSRPIGPAYTRFIVAQLEGVS
jgi:hypothetical protein